MIGAAAALRIGIAAGSAPALDPRLFQIASLGGLLAVNLAWFDMGASLAQSAVTLTAAPIAQALFCRLYGRAFDWRSPVITGLSLSLLLRTHEPLLWIAAALLAIGSKFLIRVRGKHLFNPAAFAIVALLFASALSPSGGVWVSPGQWGSAVWQVLLVTSLGGLVLTRSRRLDTALAFLACYAGLLLIRCLWLGDPLAIPLHQLQSGALLLFAFFMVTDPRSTPDSRVGRMLFAAGVAGLAYYLQFAWQVRTGLFYALVFVSLTTPLLDRVLPAQRFRWRPSMEA